MIQLLDDFADATDEGSTEFAMLRRLVEASGRPLSFTLLDISIYPGRWKTLLREVERANRDGLPIRGQVAGRPVAPLYGLEPSFSLFDPPELRRGRRLPLEQKLVKLRDPAMRAKLLAEEPTYRNPQMLAFMRSVGNMYVLGDPPNYTPPAESRLDKRAAKAGGRRSSWPTTCWCRATAAPSCSIPAPTTPTPRKPPTWRACCITTIR